MELRELAEFAIRMADTVQASPPDAELTSEPGS